jgi:hypothetical protein
MRPEIGTLGLRPPRGDILNKEEEGQHIFYYLKF